MSLFGGMGEIKAWDIEMRPNGEGLEMIAPQNLLFMT